MFHRLIAFFRRTFWTYCPRCHKHFGGHQEHHHQVLIEGENYRIVCGRCKRRVEFNDFISRSR